MLMYILEQDGNWYRYRLTATNEGWSAWVNSPSFDWEVYIEPSDRLKGKVLQVLSDGVLLADVSFLEIGSQRWRAIPSEVIVSMNTANCFDGDFLDIPVKESGSVQYTTLLGAPKKVRAYIKLD